MRQLSGELLVINKKKYQLVKPTGFIFVRTENRLLFANSDTNQLSPIRL
jgi:hypothetical protein